MPKSKKRKNKVVDVSKLKDDKKQMQIPVTVGGRDFIALLEVSKDANAEQIAAAKRNVHFLIAKQMDEAWRQASWWKKLYRRTINFFKSSPATRRANAIIHDRDAGE
jgi:hypothetical protein